MQIGWRALVWHLLIQVSGLFMAVFEATARLKCACVVVVVSAMYICDGMCGSWR